MEFQRVIKKQNGLISFLKGISILMGHQRFHDNFEIFVLQYCTHIKCSHNIFFEYLAPSDLQTPLHCHYQNFSPLAHPQKLFFLWYHNSSKNPNSFHILCTEIGKLVRKLCKGRYYLRKYSMFIFGPNSIKHYVLLLETLQPF